jgi:hypothetical protein
MAIDYGANAAPRSALALSLLWNRAFVGLGPGVLTGAAEQLGDAFTAVEHALSPDKTDFAAARALTSGRHAAS